MRWFFALCWLPNYAIKRDLRENISFKSIIRRVGPLSGLLGVKRNILAASARSIRSSHHAFRELSLWCGDHRTTVDA